MADRADYADWVDRNGLCEKDCLGKPVRLCGNSGELQTSFQPLLGGHPLGALDELPAFGILRLDPFMRFEKLDDLRRCPRGIFMSAAMYESLNGRLSG